MNSFFAVFNFFGNISSLLTLNFNLNTTQLSSLNYKVKDEALNSVKFQSDSVSPSYTSEDKFSDSTTYGRFIRFNNPLISYDYKTGHYLGI
jgi:hypothetical protein